MSVLCPFYDRSVNGHLCCRLFISLSLITVKFPNLTRIKLKTNRNENAEKVRPNEFRNFLFFLAFFYDRTELELGAFFA